LLSRDGETAWFPDIAADPTGRIHMAWNGDSGLDYDAVWYTSSPDGFNWPPPNDIAVSAPIGELTRPSLAADNQGVLHMTYRRRIPLYYAHARADQAYSGNAWELGPVMNEEQVAYFSRLLFDDAQRLHLVYTQAVITDDCVCYRVFYRHSDTFGRIWTPSVELSDPSTGSAKPQIVVDKTGAIHVVWEAGRGGSYGQLSGKTRVMYASSSDGGNTWSVPITFPASDEGKKITIGVDANDHVIVAWHGLPENLIFYQVSTDRGKTWSSPQPIAGAIGMYVTPLDTMSMALDSGGNVHLVFMGNRAGVPLVPGQKPLFSVMHAIWNGSSWSDPDVIAQHSGDVPEWPRIAVALGNQLNVTWFTRDEANVFTNDERRGYKVWYSRSSTSAPAVAPVAYPTIAPTAVATADLQAQSVQPTAPARINSAPSQIDYPSLRTEVDDYGMLLLSGLPVAVIFLLGFLFLRRRRA
jgi:hypothetical protein